MVHLSSIHTYRLRFATLASGMIPIWLNPNRLCSLVAEVTRPSGVKMALMERCLKAHFIKDKTYPLFRGPTTLHVVAAAAGAMEVRPRRRRWRRHARPPQAVPWVALPSPPPALPPSLGSVARPTRRWPGAGRQHPCFRLGRNATSPRQLKYFTTG